MKTFAGLLASASLVAGHGYVTNGTLDSESYTFYQPYTDPYMSPTPSRISRPIQGNGPVTVVTYDDIQCGGDTAAGIDGSSPANLTAAVTAGSTVDLYWTLWPTSHVGPTITYMARCANDDCTTYMPGNDTVWFKIQEDGRDGTSDTWGATAVMTAGGYISYTVPECIESGAYLVRHEIIALHAAETEGGAQFYPGCHQVKVSGGTGAVTPSNLVAFPGAYKATDPGILYNPYEATAYTIPGPALFTCSGSSSSSNSTSSSSSSSSSSSAAAVVAPSSAAVSSAGSTTFATVTRSASPSTTAAALAQTSAASASDGEGDDGCDAEETVTSTITASSAIQTSSSAGDDGEDDGCEPEETLTSTVVDAQPTTLTSTVVASQPTETSSSSSTTTSASSGDDSGDDDGCDAEGDGSDAGSVTTNPESGSSASSSSPDDSGDDDGCDADGEGDSTPTAAAAATTSAPRPTGRPASSSGGDDGEDCDAEEEQNYAQRYKGHFPRGPRGLGLMFDA